MPIPEYRDDGWLPEGHYDASWEEVIARFSGQPDTKRRRLMQGLLDWRDCLKVKGISGRLILDGSFISNKPNPGDFDAIFLYDDHVGAILERDPEAKSLLDYANCKNTGFDMFVFPAAAALASPEWVHLDVFDRDKETGKPKGVLEVLL